jgi:hypothetical protein
MYDLFKVINFVSYSNQDQLLCRIIHNTDQTLGKINKTAGVCVFKPVTMDEIFAWGVHVLMQMLDSVLSALK